MSVLVQFKEFLYSGDPLIRTWFMVTNDYAPFALCATYLLLVTRILPALMQRRKPLQLRNLMIAYNFSLVLAYLTVLCHGLYCLLTTDCLRYLCKEVPFRRGHQLYTIVCVIWVVYLLKYIELVDTIFFVLRKKDHLISDLHLVHHAGLPLIAFLLIRSERTGFQVLPCMLNCFVHVIMYAYYGLAAMGPRVQKYLWWKQYLTIVQITQFVIMLVYLLVIGPLVGCRTSKPGHAIMAFFVSLVFWLFYKFYNKTYAAQQRKAQTPERKVRTSVAQERSSAGQENDWAVKETVEESSRN